MQRTAASPLLRRRGLPESARAFKRFRQNRRCRLCKPLGLTKFEMNNYSASISLSCDKSSLEPRPVYVEPRGEDFWLFPGDEFEIVAHSHNATPAFTVVESPASTQAIVANECFDVSVYHDGVRVPSGYQRARFAGFIEDAFNIIGRGVVVTSNKPWEVHVKVQDQLRLLIPQKAILPAQILGIEHLNAGSLVLENPWGLFLGQLDISYREISSGSRLYKLES